MSIQVLLRPRSTGVQQRYLTAVVVTALLVMTSRQAAAEYSNDTTGIAGKTF